MATAIERIGLKATFSQACRVIARPDEDGDAEFVDAAYWVKGCSSLGRLRYAVLARVLGCKTRKVGLALLDYKEAVKPAPNNGKLPANNGERIVAGARALSPLLGNRMLAVFPSAKEGFVRELLPEDLKLDAEPMKRKALLQTASFLGVVLGQAHARQLSHEDRCTWVRELYLDHSKGAPAWLWHSVTDLLAIHERAYLEHCRRQISAARPTIAGSFASGRQYPRLATGRA